MRQEIEAVHIYEPTAEEWDYIFERDEVFRKEYEEWLDAVTPLDDYDNRRLHVFPAPEYME